MTISEAIERVSRTAESVDYTAIQENDDELLHVGIGHLRQTGAVDMFKELEEILAEKQESADATWKNGYRVFGDQEAHFGLTPDKRVRMSLQWGFDPETELCKVIQVLVDTHPGGSIYVYGQNIEKSLTIKKVGNQGGKEILENAIARAYLAPARLKGQRPPEPA